MTECSPVISTNLSWNIRKDSVGQLMPNCQAKSVDGRAVGERQQRYDGIL